MTDLERLELILRRLSDRAPSQTRETSPWSMLKQIVEELTKENNAIAKRAADRIASAYLP